MIAFIGTLIGVPVFQNIQFSNVVKTLADFIAFSYQATLVTTHNHRVIIHNQEVLTDNQRVIIDAIDKHDSNLSLLSQLRNDTETDWQNITLPTKLHEEDAHYDIKIN